MNKITENAIIAYKAGDKNKARLLFEQATQQYENDIQAWLGLASTALTPEKRLEATIRVLQLDANNVSAMKRLAQMRARDEIIIQIKEPDIPSITTMGQEKTLFQVYPSVMYMLMIFSISAMISVISLFNIVGDQSSLPILSIISMILLGVGWLYFQMLSVAESKLFKTYPSITHTASILSASAMLIWLGSFDHTLLTVCVVPIASFSSFLFGIIRMISVANIRIGTHISNIN